MQRTTRLNRAPRWATFALTTLVAWSGVSTAAVKDSSASGFTVENVEVVPVDAATAWKALVHDVDRWWPKDHTWWGKESKLSIDARAGACFCEIAGARQAQHMTVTFVDPGTTLRMVGGLGPLQGMGLHGALEFRLAPADNGGTRITLYYRVGGYSPDDLGKFAPVVDQVQAVQLRGLADYLRKAHK
ncbi:SRPBCC domain-containing protein [Lysobacter sp. LF1]|uniref:SRPBCC domain-containing protein n=1 Tax=Lysobacter stagni TaxID=3045172 RepID=A0ABT6XJL3_9GAMM|nr:SRPBCC domain-containing protein [Lysobacter sp. LF1]MDI9240138.1 SRPBCC domain-containing protein [Lysobacter sp. LF1]